MLRNGQSVKSLTILFVPVEGQESFSSCQVLAEELRERGHRIVFAIDTSSKGLLIPYGFEEEIQESSKTNDYFNKKLPDINPDILGSSAIEVVKHYCFKDMVKKFEYMKEHESYYEKLIDRVKPNIIITDATICSPALTNSGIPWVWLKTGSPNLCFNYQSIPPAWSGMAKNGKTQEWDSFREQWNEIFKDLKSDLNEWLVSRGAPKLPEDLFHPHSPYLNIYTHPKELDYKIFEALPKNWIRFDCLKKPVKNIEKFSIPEKLMSKPGKLIYLSMGDFAELELMKRLTTSLSKSQNKFIVSKGPSHDKYELPDNMWGIEKLPEKSVIPLVDLVMTVGDNETVFDAFYFSKPLIVLPLIGEQLDNGQRVRENGFGLDLNPYTCNDMALFGSIYGTLDDLLLRRRMTAISYRMRTSDSIKQASTMIENILN